MHKLAAALLLLASTPALGQTSLSGQAEVIDGDSLTVGGLSVRLYGIDAPEGTQTCMKEGQAWGCGEESGRQLATMIAGQPVRCSGRDIDAYGRALSVCTVGHIDLNQAMVESGWATAFRKYSSDYVAAEEKAKAHRLGIWNSTFVPPEQFRAAQAPREPASRLMSAPVPVRPAVASRAIATARGGGSTTCQAFRTTTSPARRRCSAAKPKLRRLVNAGLSCGEPQQPLADVRWERLGELCMNKVPLCTRPRLHGAHYVSRDAQERHALGALRPPN